MSSLNQRYRVNIASHSIKRAGFAGAWLGVVLIGLTTAMTTGPARAEEYTVKMTNALTFEPGNITIHAGDTVTWRNKSVLVHTATAMPSKATDKSDVALPKSAEPFNSGRMKPGTSYSHTFKVAGDYRYFCIPHEAAGMVGEVVVKP